MCVCAEEGDEGGDSGVEKAKENKTKQKRTYETMPLK